MARSSSSIQSQYPASSVEQICVAAVAISGWD
jgi:hypothetical protein